MKNEGDNGRKRKRGDEGSEQDEQPRPAEYPENPVPSLTVSDTQPAPSDASSIDTLPKQGASRPSDRPLTEAKTKQPKMTKEKPKEEGKPGDEGNLKGTEFCFECARLSDVLYEPHEHAPKNIEACVLCKTRDPYVACLLAHDGVHVLNDQFVCPKCGAIFQDCVRLKKHVKTYHKTKYRSCLQCKRMYRAYDFMAKHKKLNHRLRFAYESAERPDDPLTSWMSQRVPLELITAGGWRTKNKITYSRRLRNRSAESDAAPSPNQPTTDSEEEPSTNSAGRMTVGILVTQKSAKGSYTEDYIPIARGGVSHAVVKANAPSANPKDAPSIAVITAQQHTAAGPVIYDHIPIIPGLVTNAVTRRDRSTARSLTEPSSTDASHSVEKAGASAEQVADIVEDLIHINTLVLSEKLLESREEARPTEIQKAGPSGYQAPIVHHEGPEVGNVVPIPSTLEPLVCHLCPEKLGTRVRHYFHIEECHKPIKEGDLIYCPFCLPKPVRFCGILALQNHVDRFHQDNQETNISEDDLKCPACGEKFRTRIENLKHARICEILVPPKRFRCDLCRKKFNSESKIVSHILKEHGSAKAWICKTCWKGFPTKIQFVKHYLTHRHVKTKTCYLCRKEFKNRLDVLRHLKDEHG